MSRTRGSPTSLFSQYAAGPPAGPQPAGARAWAPRRCGVGRRADQRSAQCVRSSRTRKRRRPKSRGSVSVPPDRPRARNASGPGRAKTAALGCRLRVSCTLPDRRLRRQQGLCQCPGDAGSARAAPRRRNGWARGTSDPARGSASTAASVLIAALCAYYVVAISLQGL